MEVTHQRESLKRKWQCTGEDDPTRLGTAVNKGLESSSFQAPLNESQNGNFVQDALSNSVVLRHIFTFLDDDDLESCCHVCQDWRTAADPLVVSLYEIKLIYNSTRSYSIRMNDTSLLVRERDRYNRKNVTERKDLKGCTQILDLILTQTLKVSISLEVLNIIDMLGDETVKDFLSKLGPFVHDLDLCDEKMSAVDLCKLLLQIFPSLKKLKIARFNPNTSFYEGFIKDQHFDTDLDENKHKQLKTIVFGVNDFNYSDMVSILKTCPNLKEIEDFPLEVINAVVIAQKGQALKSLAHRAFRKIGETAVTAFQILARLQPKLTSLKLNSQFSPVVKYLTLAREWHGFNLAFNLQQLRLDIFANDMSNSLLKLAQSLTIVVRLNHSEETKWGKGGALRLDHGFTGLPEEVIDQLVDPSSKKAFTEEEIQGFKDHSIICKLKELKELKLYVWDARTYYGYESGSYMQLTPVVNEFGFELLSELKVTVVEPLTPYVHRFFRSDPEPLALCSNVDYVTGNSDREW